MIWCWDSPVLFYVFQLLGPWLDVVVDVVKDHDDAHQEGTQVHSSGVLGLYVSRR